jgi:hypothetical protein
MAKISYAKLIFCTKLKLPVSSIRKEEILQKYARELSALTTKKKLISQI